MYYLVTFRSRTNAVRFNDALKHAGVNSQLVSSPKGIDIGCGLAVKTFDLQDAKRVLSYGDYSSFYAIFEYDQTSGYTKVY